MKEFRNVHQCHVMQREHTPTTWRHPKKSNINWHHGFNLQLRELVPMTGVGVCGYSGERPPHTVIGRVRLPGWYGAKKGKKEWDFLFLSVRIQSTPSIFVHTHFLLPDKSYVVIMLITSKEREGKNKEKGKTTWHKKLFFLLLLVVRSGDEILSELTTCRLKGWIEVFIFTKITLKAEMHISKTCPVYSNWICLTLFVTRVAIQWVLQLFALSLSLRHGM